MQNNTLSRADLSYDSGVAMNVHYGDILVKFGEVLDIKSERLPMIVDETVLDKYKSSFLKNGDIIIADTAEDETVGKCTEIAGLSDEYVISGLHTIPYRPLQKFAFGYLGYYMNSTSYHNQLLPLMQGIKVTSISKVSLQNTVIIYPKSKVEQAAIGKYFYNLDNLITLHQRKIQLYNRFMTIVWEQRKAEELCSISTGKSNTQDQIDDGKYPFYIRSDIPVRSDKYLYDCEAVITIGDGNIGKVFHYVKGKFDLHQRCYKMTDFNGILGKYYYYFFSTNFYERAMRMTAKGTVDSVRLDMISKMDIKMPKKISEQKKIADCLTKLDNLITLHQWKWYFFDKKVGNAWEQRKLGELGSVSMCRRIFKEQTSERGDIPFYKIGTFGAVADAFISKELFEEYKLKYPYPKKGDILISASGSIGRTVEFTGKNEYFQDSNIVWLNHDERLSNTFLKCFYSVVKWTGIEGSTIKRLYNDNILNTVINLPSIHEQNKIGAYFAKIDNLITLHQWKWFVYGKIRGIVWIQRKSIKILVIQRKYTLLRVVIVFEWFIICCVCFENIQLRFIAVIEFKIFCIIVDEYVVLIVIECIYVIVVFEVYYALLEFVLIIKSCYVFDDGLFL